MQTLHDRIDGSREYSERPKAEAWPGKWSSRRRCVIERGKTLQQTGARLLGEPLPTRLDRRRRTAG